MHGKGLRRLFILSLLAAAGLLSLQGYWIRQNWRDTENVLSRQLNYSFRKATEEEGKFRVDSFYRAIYQVVTDSSYHSYTYVFTKRSPRIVMQNSRDEKDFSTMHISLIHDEIDTATTPRDSILAIIKKDVWAEIQSNILNDFYHILYTRLYNSLYWKYYHQLKLDTAHLRRLLQTQLSENRIEEQPVIRFFENDNPVGAEKREDAHQRDKAGNALSTDTLVVDYLSVKDMPRKYKAVAFLPSPGRAIFRRTWLSWLSCALLIGLTLYCLYRMYRIIIRQKQLDTMKNDFIGNMTHELKTPLATIGAAIDGLQHYDALKDRDKTDRYLNASRKQLQRLDLIITEVLNMAIYEAKKVQLAKKEIPLKRSIGEIVESFRISSGAVFSCDLVCEPDIVLFADPFHFTNIMVNLLDNAVKYVPENLVITIVCETAPGKIVIRVGDNGRGIQPESLTHIFDRFYRVPTGNIHDVRGFGIGLFYVRQIVELHGGTATAHSRVGKGTTIILAFPAGKNNPS